MSLLRIQIILLLISVLLFTLLGLKWWPQEEAGFSLQPDPMPSKQASLYHEQFISFPANEDSAAHAAAATLRNDGKILATWYEGSREGARDVLINSTVIDPNNHVVSPPLPIASPLQTEQDTWRYVRKLGNGVVHQLPAGRLMLMYVSVSFGGWAASNLNIRFSDNGGLSWTPARRIVTSPFLNISTLVKGKPLNLSNGHIAVPVYHEFLGKFGELLIIDPQGRVVNKHRLSWGREAIQPSVVALTRTEALALLRDSGEQHKSIASSRTSDGGNTWSPLQWLQLPNPNAAIAALTTTDGRIIMVFNNDEEERNNLSLAISSNSGNSWKVIHAFEDQEPVPGKKIKFSYPYLIRGNDNDYHLFYTWRKHRIKYIHFNDAWLAGLL